MPILIIAQNTVKGYMKEKVPLVVLVFAFILMVASYVLSPLAVGAQQKIIIDIGLASVSILAVLLIILLGATSFYREKEKGILSTILSKPVGRVDFIIGKYLGTITTILIVMVFMVAVFLSMMFLSKTPVTGAILWSVYLSVIEMMLIAGFMALFSSFSTPVMSAFFTLCIFAGGHLSKDILIFGQSIGDGAFKIISRAAFYILPDLSLFNIRQEAVHGLPLQDGFLYTVTIYGLFYTLFLLLLSALIFRVKEIK